MDSNTAALTVNTDEYGPYSQPIGDKWRDFHFRYGRWVFIVADTQEMVADAMVEHLFPFTTSPRTPTRMKVTGQYARIDYNYMSPDEVEPLLDKLIDLWNWTRDNTEE